MNNVEVWHDIKDRFIIVECRDCEVKKLVAAKIKRALQAQSEGEREFFSQLSQLLNGWKQGCAPGEWSHFDESVLQQWEAYKAQMVLR